MQIINRSSLLDSVAPSIPDNFYEILCGGPPVDSESEVARLGNERLTEMLQYKARRHNW